MAEKISKVKINATQEVKLLRRIIELTNVELDLELVLNDIVGMVYEITNADSVLIYLHDHHKESLTLRASHMRHDIPLTDIKLSDDEGIAGWVAKNQEMIEIEKEAYLDKRFKRFESLPEDNFESILSVPIQNNNKTVGVINIQFKEPHKWMKSVTDLIAVIGKQIGGIIEHARLYRETKLQAIQFQAILRISRLIAGESYLDEVLDVITEVTSEMLHSKVCSILLLDEKTKTLKIKAVKSLSEYYEQKPPVKIDNSLSGEVMMSKKSRAVFDVRNEKKYVYGDLAEKIGLSSLLLVPLFAGDEAIGIINVYTKNPHEFTKDEMETMRIIANQVSIKIQNTKLDEASEKAKQALEDRKVIEKAKGILMQTQQISEEESYKWLRKRSMDSCKTMKEIADAIILTNDLSK